MNDTNKTISAEFDYPDQSVDVLGSQLHYVETGEGAPILFLHGIPTWSYMWRNVMPVLHEAGRCIAVDLIGMGRSDKPDIDYTVFDHIDYITEFIDTLGLSDITLVMHGWGSVIGFAYAMSHPEKIKGLAFLEAHIRAPSSHDMLSLPVQELATLLQTDDGGYAAIMEDNYYVNEILPRGILRTLTDAEMAAYQQPFKDVKSRKLIWQYLQDLPKGDQKTAVSELIQKYSEFLQQSKLPKLMLFAVPGFITTMDTVVWAKQHLPELSLVDIEDALHYATESNPERIGIEIKHWYSSL